VDGADITEVGEKIEVRVRAIEARGVSSPIREREPVKNKHVRA
jgi:hypothetical protein